MVEDNLDEYGLPLWPAAERNKQPIADELRTILPKSGGLFLEISSGTGQHILHFASIFRHYVFQPSDCDEKHLATLIKRRLIARLDHLKPPARLDVTDDVWPLDSADVIYNANMMHIAPWEAAEGLFRGAGRLLAPGGLLLTYGPYMFEGKHTAESNERFDASLKSRDPGWGVRDVSDLRRVAQDHGIQYERAAPLPANNFLLVWRKADSADQLP